MTRKVHTTKFHPGSLRMNKSLAAMTVTALTWAALSACAPIISKEKYAPSDGIRAAVGNIEFNNLLVVSKGKDEEGKIIGAVTNSSSDSASVWIATSDKQIDLPMLLKGKETVSLHADKASDVSLARTPVSPGSTLVLRVTGDDGKETTLRVPVVDGTLKEYREALG